MPPVIKEKAALATLYLFASAAGWLFAVIGMPLPWMMGPLIFTAIAYIFGPFNVEVPIHTRPVGQAIIAAQVGLAFTPTAVAALLALAPLMIGMALVTALCACIIGVLLARLADMPLPQAFLITFPTSPVEAAVLAERCHSDPAPIILAQTTRIAAIVVLVPIAIYSVDGWPDRSTIAAGGSFDVLGNGFLALLAVSGALLFRKLGLSNPFFLGPLFLSSLAAAVGLHPVAFPPPILAMAQIVLGTWLGSTFHRDLFLKGGSAVIATLTSTLALLVAVSALAVLIAIGAGQDPIALVLGAAPGGVTEMALTAKFVGADLALVTAFQLTRIFILIPNLPWFIGIVERLDQRRRS